jgi:RNA polymerase sigma-70 factor (ECF subfamily)
MSTADALGEPSPAYAAELYREHGRTVRAFVAARVRDPGAVEDIVQESFVAVFARGAPLGQEGPWLVGIARNKVLKYMRDRETTAVAEPTLASPDPGPGEAAGAVEERARVRRAVLSLEEPLREVLLLRYEGGLDYQAIAERLGLTPTTVQGRLKRAKVALRDVLEPREGRST